MINEKGASSLFTGILIILLSVVVMVTMIALITPFFSGIKDGMIFKNNKETILSINEKLLSIKDGEIGSVFELEINPNNQIEIDKNNNKIIIRQEIKNENTKIKEQTINNLTILKKNNEIVLTLDLNGIVDINTESMFLTPTKQKIKIEIEDIEDNIPYISFRKILGTVNVIILPEDTYFYETLKITATVIPADSNIYYTLDGTEPTQNSELYSNAINITETKTINLKAFKEGYEPSNVVTKTYIKIE